VTSMTSTSGAGVNINTVRDLIDRMACTRPDVAFLFSTEAGRVLTFKALKEQSHRLYGWFRQMGLEHGDKIAFMMDNGLFTAQLFLGAMYGGFVSVPLNVRAGVSQLSYTLDHCDAKVVFVGSKYDALIKEVMVHVRRPVEIISADLDSCPELSEMPSVRGILHPIKPEDAALLMYSSGTTGQPNGAVHTHRSVLAHGRNSARAHQLTAADRSLLVLPIYHINAECVTLMPTLASGGSVVIPHGFVVSEFWNWLDDYRCTWSALVPTIISQLLDWKDPKTESRAAAFRRIRFLRTSSAPLSPSLHREFLDKFKLLLIQAMGSTETGSPFSNPLPPGENKIGSPGLPWGFETKIVNRDGAELPVGEPGEVLMRGDGMMQGYYKDPLGTAAALDTEGWLHTGDLSYRDEDGYFFVVGRSKELIIKGGMNIAPKQIDEVLEAHPAVLEAAAVGVPDRYLGEDMVAFAVLRDGMSCDERELRGFCEKHLGHFKTPTRIHFVNDLPRGPSGKVQRLKLEEDAAQPEAGSYQGKSAGLSDGRASPAVSVVLTTPIDQIVAEAWAKLLTQPQVDEHTNFFALGGHSLMAIECLSLLREKLPIALSLTDFFENPTVAQQAALIRKRLRADNFSSFESIVAWESELLQKVGPPTADEAIPLRDRSLPCPLSRNQMRLWFMEQLNSGVPVYNESEAVRLRGALNIDVLEKALNVIIARHEILRTTIQATGDQTSAVVQESWQLRLKQIDLSLLPPAQREAEVDRLLIDEPRLPHHLEIEPGIRATLLRLGQIEHVFIVMMHHIICDWSSEGVLWRELSALYRAGCGGQPLELPALSIQHGDYAAWQQQQTTLRNLGEDLAYWEENLREAPALLDLPTDNPRPHIMSYRGARQRFQIPSALVLALRDCSRREKVSLFTVITAALDTLFYRYTGQEDILLGIPLADRDRPELQSMIGFLLHTHVLRTQVSGDLSFRKLLARVQKGVLDLYAHRFPSFDEVVSRVRPQRNPSYSPLFQVMINWRDRDQALSFIGLEGIEVESLLSESRTAKFDLTLMLTDEGDNIDLQIEYNTDLFDGARIERMVGHLLTLLEGAAANPEHRLADLPLLTNAERRQLLVEWNTVKVDEIS
jgi:acyl-CoA synthetase (AMP-forming)/AMP-acid ligase II/acyl carrier protein